MRSRIERADVGDIGVGVYLTVACDVVHLRSDDLDVRGTREEGHLCSGVGSWNEG